MRTQGIGLQGADRRKDNEFDFRLVKFGIHIRKIQKKMGNAELKLRSNIWAGDRYLDSMGEVAQGELYRERPDNERANTKYQ